MSHRENVSQIRYRPEHYSHGSRIPAGWEALCGRQIVAIADTALEAAEIAETEGFAVPDGVLPDSE